MNYPPLFESTLKSILECVERIDTLRNGENSFEDWEFEFTWMFLVRTVFDYCIESNYDIQGFIEKYHAVDKDLDELTEDTFIEIEFKMLYTYTIAQTHQDVFEMVKHIIKFSNEDIKTEEEFREELELEIQTLKEQDISIESVV